MENFEELIAKETFLKNIKRCYLTKIIMESFNIEKVSILYNNDIIKSFEIKFNRNDDLYFFKYKIKRRRNKCVLKNNRKLKIKNNSNNTNNTNNIMNNSDSFNELTEEETTSKN